MYCQSIYILLSSTELSSDERVNDVIRRRLGLSGMFPQKHSKGLVIRKQLLSVIRTIYLKHTSWNK